VNRLNTSIDVDDQIQTSLNTYSDMIVRIAYQNLKSMADAEDIAQEVFLKRMTASPAFENETHEKAWIIRVTVNLCKDFLKSSWFKKTTALDENIPSPDENNEVLDAVMHLPVKFRNVIYLHYYEDMTVAQIAGILQKKENTVSSWLHRARKLLKESLTGGFDDE